MSTQPALPEIDLSELMVSAPTLIAWKLGLVHSEDEAAAFMYHGGPVSPTASEKPTPGDDDRPDRSYWEAVKTEMHAFLCTDDKRYQELWKRIRALESKSTTALVGVIATFLGASIGAPATLIAGFVAVCLYGVAKLGTEAYCRYREPRKP